MQMLHCFIKGTYWSIDFNILGSPRSNPMWILRYYLFPLSDLASCLLNSITRFLILYQNSDISVASWYTSISMVWTITPHCWFPAIAYWTQAWEEMYVMGSQQPIGAESGTHWHCPLEVFSHGHDNLGSLGKTQCLLFCFFESKARKQSISRDSSQRRRNTNGNK